MTNDSIKQPSTFADLNNAEIVWMADLGKYIPVSQSTLWRFVLRGVAGVKLMSGRIGNRRFTKKQWIVEFLEASEKATEELFQASKNDRMVNDAKQRKQKARESIARELGTRQTNHPLKHENKRMRNPK